MQNILSRCGEPWNTPKEKEMFKKVMNTMMAAAMVLAMTGCSGSGTPSGTSTSAAPEKIIPVSAFEYDTSNIKKTGNQD